MSAISKGFLLIIVVEILILLFIPVIVTADSISDPNLGCSLTAISPVSNKVFNNTLPVNVNLAWVDKSVVIFIYFNVSYSIDDGQKISIAQGNNPSFNSTAQGTAYHFEYLVFPPSTSTTATDIDISSLTSGAHKMTIFADGEYNLNNDFINPFHYTSSPIYFSVDYLATYPTTSPTISTSPTHLPTLMPTANSPATSTPTPSVPEFSWLTILTILLIIPVGLILSKKGSLREQHI